jgi:hypothetical protein
MEGLQQTLEVKSPVSGTVAYRNPSPGTVYRADPLLVIGPPNTFRLRARLPLAQANALRGTTSISIELCRILRSSNEDMELPPQQLVRRFSGSPLHFCSLDDDPSIVLVELACRPPDEAVRDLALGETVRAELVWIPPLYTLPLFVIGAVPLILGSVGILIARVRRGNAMSGALNCTSLAYEPAAANTCLRTAVPDAAPLRLLGEQLGEMIKDEQVDPSLLATVEWALDRHGRKGARLMAQGLQVSGINGDGLNRLIERSIHGSLIGRDLLRNEQVIDRLISFLGVIAPHLLPHPKTCRVNQLS